MFCGRCAPLLRQTPPDSGTLSLLLTSDEERPAIDGLQKMVSWLKERGIAPNLFLIGEPTGSCGKTQFYDELKKTCKILRKKKVVCCSVARFEKILVFVAI